MQDKTNLLGYSQKSLEVFFKDIGEPSFRAKQLLKWVHQKGELDFGMMTDFNKTLRERLKSIAISQRHQLLKVFLHLKKVLKNI